MLQTSNFKSTVLFVLLIISSNILAQTAVTINTPNNTPVTVLVLTEMSQSQIASTNANAAALYPNATILSNSSSTYNCHAHAWYLTECTGCTKYWMNTPNDDKYWQDNSYVEVTEAQAQKISYSNDDHSAIKSVVSGKYDSKWGQWPVMRHSPNYTPYISTNLKYYARTRISGNSDLCTSSSYSVNVPSGSIVTWSSTPSSALSVTQNGSTTTATRIGNYNGSATITATVTYPTSGTQNFSKSLKIGNPIINFVSFSNGFDGEEYFCTSHNGNMYNIYPQLANTTYQYRLRKYPNLNVVYTSPTGRSASDQINYIPQSGWYEFQARATNACGTGPWVGYEVEYLDCSILNFRNTNTTEVYPNPANAELFFKRINTGNVGSMENRTLTESDPFTVELYDFNGTLVVTEKYNNLNEESSLNVSEFKKGNYILKIIARKTEETHLILIQ